MSIYAYTYHIPTSAPPPSRLPPSRPTQVSRAEIGSFGSNNASKKDNEFSSFDNSSQCSQSPKLTSGTMMYEWTVATTFVTIAGRGILL